MNTLKVALIQAELHWEDAAQNRARFSELISTVSADTDIILLPEMFTTGFSMHPHRLAESMDGPTLAWMSAEARTKNAVIAGSVIIAVGEAYFNRLIWMEPNGNYKTYDKRHLFTLAGEEKVYTKIEIRLCAVAPRHNDGRLERSASVFRGKAPQCFAEVS